jgi:hypothetical protein
MNGRPSRWLAERVARAAWLRAAGNSWAAVARVLGCRPETCMRWEVQYPEWWAHVKGLANRERDRAMWAEVEQTLRQLLRSMDPKERLWAVDMIHKFEAAYPGRLSPTVLSEAERVVAAETAGRVRVVRVTANPPAPGPATSRPPPAAGPSASAGLVRRSPAPAATPALSALRCPPTTPLGRSAGPHRPPAARLRTDGLLVGAALACLGLLIGAGVIDPVLGVMVLAVFGWLVWDARPAARGG